MDFGVAYVPLGMNTIILYFIFLKLIKHFKKSFNLNKFNLILIFLVVCSYFEQITAMLFFNNILSNFTLPLNSVLFFIMIQGCNWIYYYRSVIIFNLNKNIKIKYLLILPPLIVLICQILDVTLFYLQYYNIIIPSIFVIDSSTTIVIEIITELVLYSHTFINIFKVPTLKKHFIQKQIIIKYFMIVALFLSTDLLIIITAYLSIVLSLNFKSTSYLIRYYLIIKLFSEISDILWKSDITNKTSSSTSHELSVNNKSNNDKNIQNDSNEESFSDIVNLPS